MPWASQLNSDSSPSSQPCSPSLLVVAWVRALKVEATPAARNCRTQTQQLAWLASAEIDNGVEQGVAELEVAEEVALRT